MRFPHLDLKIVGHALESIHKFDRLTEIHLTAIDTPSVDEAFKQT